VGSAACPVLAPVGFWWWFFLVPGGWVGASASPLLTGFLGCSSAFLFLIRHVFWSSGGCFCLFVFFFVVSSSFGAGMSLGGFSPLVVFGGVF